jgi:hypothetical protein
MFVVPSNGVPQERNRQRSAWKHDDRDGTRGAQPPGMATKTKRSSEAWTVPLHVIMWTTMTVGFIMTLVVLLMRR